MSHLQLDLSPYCAEEGGFVPDAASHLLNDHRANRAERITYTKAGVGIGRAYVPPPAPMGSEAERIQRGLLRRAPASMWDEERESPWLLLLYAGGFAGALLLTHFCARCSAA